MFEPSVAGGPSAATGWEVVDTLQSGVVITRRTSNHNERKRIFFGELARRALRLDSDELIEEAVEASVDIVGAEAGVYLSVENGGELVVRAWEGLDAELGDSFGLEASRDTAAGHAVLEDEIVVVDDFSDSKFARTSIGEDHDMSSAMFIPVTERDRALGVFGKYNGQPATFDAADIELVEGIAALVADVLEREWTQRRREETYERMIDVVREREEIFSIISHDLRSPASTIKLQLGLLRRNYDQLIELHENIRHSLDRAEKGLDQMVDLTTKLLDDAGRRVAYELNIEEVNFTRVLQDVVDRFRDTLVEEQSQFSVDIEANLSGEGDRVRFEQIATNILSNAVKYGDGNPVDVSLSGDDGSVYLVVRDRGIGIASEEHPKIFGQFHRVNPEDTRDSYGMGLWIVQKCVDVLSGEIDLASTPGEGATFTVTLPRYFEH
jgi:signal transduction histidine kinase